MEAPPSSLPTRPRTKFRKAPFATAVLYENLRSAESARWFHGKLIEKFRREFEFSHWMWNFVVLDLPQIARQAVEYAVDADQVILSMAGTHELPGSVKDWLERWVRHTQRKNPALVTLFPCHARHDIKTATHSFLRQVVAAGPVRFFPEARLSPYRHRPE